MKNVSTMKAVLLITVCSWTFGVLPASTFAQAPVIREAVEYTVKKFGLKLSRSAMRETVEELTSLSERYGDDLIDAYRKAGPNVIQAVKRSDGLAGEAISVARRHGSKSHWILISQKRLQLYSKYGDDAAKAMIRHPGIASDLIDIGGKNAAKALSKTSPHSARRIAILSKDPKWKDALTNPELWKRIEQFGDRAVDFIWRNKVTLAGSALLASFIANPEPYLKSAERSVDHVLDNIGTPIAEEAAKQIPWWGLSWFAAVVSCVVAIMSLRWVGRKLLVFRGKSTAGNDVLKDSGELPHGEIPNPQLPHANRVPERSTY